VIVAAGDSIRGGLLEDIAGLLRKNIRVALIYGDADYLCNWLGGEAVAFAVAAQLPDYPNVNTTSTTASQTSSLSPLPTSAPMNYFAGFNAAGYADIIVNDSYVGGVVRQWGNFSFSRIYDAGHMVPYYQPETAFTIFTRIIQGTNIGTGAVLNSSSFSTNGTRNATHTNSVPSQPSPTCWVRDINSTCTEDEYRAIAAGKGVVEFGVWYSNANDYKAPTSTVTAGKPGTPIATSTNTPSTMPSGETTSTTMVSPVGVYTATGTPVSSSALARMVELDSNSLLGTIAMALGAFAMWL